MTADDPTPAELAAAARELSAKLEAAMHDHSATSFSLSRDEVILITGFLDAIGAELGKEKGST